MRQIAHSQIGQLSFELFNCLKFGVEKKLGVQFFRFLKYTQRRIKTQLYGARNAMKEKFDFE